MVNTNELRKGNLVYELGWDSNKGGRFLDGTKEVIQVLSIGDDAINLEINSSLIVTSYLPCDHLSPIPIDEYWLLKLGFLRHERKNQIQYEDGWDDCHEFDGDLFTYCIGGLVYKGLYYVHQLQNLVFHLTDKELEYKL